MKIILDMVNLKNKVKQAMEHPYLWPEIEALQNEEQQLAQKYLYGNVKEEEFEEKLEKIKSQVPSLIVNSLVELKAVMELFNLNQAIRVKTLHELELEYSRAEKQGYPCRFSIWFYQAINGGIAMYCATQVFITKNKKKSWYCIKDFWF